ncbi:LPXTG cell wall anchor domain-containing protein [Lactobacillus sp. PV034]|nr:LPXTG cell wall anchor domain-containing protein [Lactobacillus sp. PV034]QNQ80368.1 LPXTG cell wall anchor domain-containing protein [Lactobacillus sp. PV034]
MNNLLLATLPKTGALASWIWGIIGFIIGAIALVILVGIFTQSDNKKDKN